MHIRIAINLAGGGLKNFCVGPLGKAQHIDRAVHAGLCGLYRIALVMDRRGGTSEIENFVHFYIKRKSDIVAHQLEVLCAHQSGNIVLCAGIIIVETNHIMAVSDQPLADMRANKAGPAGHQDAFCRRHCSPGLIDRPESGGRANLPRRQVGRHPASSKIAAEAISISVTIPFSHFTKGSNGSLYLP